jgi:hypothetical protein
MIWTDPSRPVAVQAGDESRRPAAVCRVAIKARLASRAWGVFFLPIVMAPIVMAQTILTTPPATARPRRAVTTLRHADLFLPNRLRSWSYSWRPAEVFLAAFRRPSPEHCKSAHAAVKASKPSHPERRVLVLNLLVGVFTNSER